MWLFKMCPFRAHVCFFHSILATYAGLLRKIRDHCGLHTSLELLPLRYAGFMELPFSEAAQTQLHLWSAGCTWLPDVGAHTKTTVGCLWLWHFYAYGTFLPEGTGTAVSGNSDNQDQ